jgi:RimJ/RimL family protein N-acetyltransferase
MNADAAVMHFFASPMTRAQSDEAIDRYAATLTRDGYSFLAAIDRGTQTFLGTIGMQIMRDLVPNLPQPTVEIGWRLTAAAQGRGLATEGAAAIINHAFNALNIPDLVAVTVPTNTASRRVMIKIGMTYRPEFTFDHPRVPAGHPYRQHVLYSLENHNLENQEERS